jgi:hypothetical protein
MHEPTYRQTLIHSWKLVWHNKNIWGLGLLSAIFAGSFGINNFLGQLFNSISTNGEIAIISWPTLNYFYFGADFNTLSLIILGIVSVAIIVGLIFVSVVSKISLMLISVDYYKKDHEPRIVPVWHKALKYFWKIFTLEILRKILFLLVLFIFSLIWINTNPFANIWTMIISVLALALTILLALAISSVTIFASGYAVIDEEKLYPSIIRGYKLFKKHFLVNVEMSIILLIIDFILIMGIILLMSLTFVPSLLIWIIAGFFANNMGLMAFGFALGLIILLLSIVLIGAVYNTFYTTTWMYMFMKMHHEGFLSRLRHYFKKLFN